VLLFLIPLNDKLMRSVFLIVCLLAIFTRCGDKKKTAPVVISPPPPTVTPAPETPCEALPPYPEPFGWTDSTKNPWENIQSFIFNPINSNEIIMVVAGTVAGYNQLLCYNIITKEKTILGNTGNFPPSVNRMGWIAFNTLDNNIYIIKSNGDSLKQLTHNFACYCPKWDFTGKSLYYFQEASGTIIASLTKISVFGSPEIAILPANLAHHAVFNKTDEVIYLKSNNSEVTLVQRKTNSQEERTLISGPHNENSPVHFSNLCIDQLDQNIYWHNKHGVFKCNLTSLKIDTLLKNCPNYTYSNCIMSYKDNELTLSQHIVKPVGIFTLFHQYKAMQLNLVNNQVTELKIFQ